MLPELDHNELVGYDPGVRALRELALIVLRAPGEHPRVAKRIRATLDLVRDRVGIVEEVWGVGESPLARLMSASIVGDFASVYLALLRGVDPTPVLVIEGLKKTLAT
jgi:glucose/mannose-6-phosphate isomerase